MRVYKTNDNKKVYKLTTKDIAIMLMVFFGITSATDIATRLNVKQPTLTGWVYRLQDAKLMVSKEAYGERHIRNYYQVTNKGVKFLMDEVLKERLID